MGATGARGADRAPDRADPVRRLASRAGVGPRRLGFAGVWTLVRARLEAMVTGLSDED